MFEPTVILAALSALGHCLVIFWPRKPLKERLDANGFPILWCNNDAQQENVACIWRAEAENPAVGTAESIAHRQSA